MTTRTLTPPKRPKIRAPEPLRTVCAREVEAAIKRSLHERGWSFADYDQACVDRYANDPFPMTPGAGAQALRTLGRVERIGIHKADRMLVVLGLHLHFACPSYRRQVLRELAAEAEYRRAHPPRDAHRATAA